MSVSEKHYTKYKLPEKVEDELGEFLHLNLQNSHHDLMLLFDTEVQLPKLTTCFMIPKEVNEYTRGIYTAYEFQENSYILLAVHFAFILFSDDKDLGFTYRFFGNKDHDNIKIFLSDNESWHEFNQSIISKL